MTAQPSRPTTLDYRQPVLHAPSTLRLADFLIPLRPSLRSSEDGALRSRLHFQHPGGGECETAEIFRGVRALYLFLI
jgi:hypothetical protein